MTEANSNPLFRTAGITIRLPFPEIRRFAMRVVEQQVNTRQSFYDRNHIPVMCGQARFIDPHTVEVDEPNGVKQRLTAGGVIIATGSRPYRPPDVDFAHPRIFDSDTILDLSFTPQSITIYGAGVVGCEYTSMFRNLECKVNLVNTRTRLLEFLDDEITDALSYHMRDRGVLIRHMETYERVEGRDDCVILHLKSGKQLKTDILLWANGRSGNCQGLGLDNVGIVPNERGQLEVNESFQTVHPHIYAVGDVVGWPSLASAAYVQGRFASTHLLTGRGDHQMVRDIPTGIYTSPEISSLGRTERELTSANIPYEIGHALFKSIARRSDHRPHGWDVEDPVSPRDLGAVGCSLLRLERVGDHSHRPGDHVAIRCRQLAPLLHQYDLQLSHHGRSLSRSGIERLQPLVLTALLARGC